MHMIRTAIAGILALFVASAAVAQTFPTVPGQSVIGRLGVPGVTGPSQAISLATLRSQLFNGAGISPDGLAGCVRDGLTDCTAGVVAAANAAANAGVPLRLGYPRGYCIKPIQFGGSSPPAGVTLASLPSRIVADSPKTGLVSCSASATGTAMVSIVNYASGNAIIPGFAMESFIISAGANNSYALMLYGSVFSNITAILRGGSVASFYVRADATHVVIDNSWNISFDTQTPGISALMQTTDGAASGTAIAANGCVIYAPFGTAAGDVVQTDYMNGGCKVDAESSTGGYGVNIGHTTNGIWDIYTEGNALGGINGTVNSKGVQIRGSSQDGVATTLTSCITCVIDVWNLASATQVRNLGDAVGQSIYVNGLPADTTPSNNQGFLGAGATNGAVIAGNGSANDVSILNATASVGCGLPHNSALWNCSGYQINGAAPSNHIMVGDGTAYRDFATGAGVTTFLATPSSANLRAALTDESGTGLAYFQGGDLGTPSAGVGTNLSGTASNLTVGNATKLATARAIGIGGSTGLTATGVNFDGTAAINPALTGTLAVTNGGTGAALTKLAWSATAPTISSGFCTSPSISSNNGTVAFAVTIGSACAGSTGVLTMPAASIGWACNFRNVTNNAANAPSQTASTATSVSVTNYVRTTGVAGNWTASDVVVADCAAY